MGDTEITISEKKEAPKIPELKETVKAIEELESLRKQNDALEAEIKRTEELRARLSLGGRSFAGQAPVEKSKEEIAAEEAKAILRKFS